MVQDFKISDSSRALVITIGLDEVLPLPKPNFRDEEHRESIVKRVLDLLLLKGVEKVLALFLQGLPILSFQVFKVVMMFHQNLVDFFEKMDVVRLINGGVLALVYHLSEERTGVYPQQVFGLYLKELGLVVNVGSRRGSQLVGQIDGFVIILKHDVGSGQFQRMAV